MNLQCKGCGAALVVEENLRTAVCPYCASPSVIQRPESPDRPEPHFALPFALTDKVAREKVSGWLKSRSVFCKSGVRQAKLEGLKGVYVPAYIYSATARSRYTASIAENYTETESYRTTDEKGNSVTKTRTVTKTEWCSLAGEHAAYVPDVLVTASRGLPDEELQAIEPFDLRMSRRMNPALLAGWIAEEPSVTQAECLNRARQEARDAVGGQLAKFMPGDGHRSLEFSTQLHDESIALALVPVWVLAARFHAEEAPFRVLLNGQTGEVQGNAPLSWVKVTVTVLTVLALVAAALLAAGAFK